MSAMSMIDDGHDDDVRFRFRQPSLVQLLLHPWRRLLSPVCWTPQVFYHYYDDDDIILKHDHNLDGNHTFYVGPPKLSI